MESTETTSIIVRYPNCKKLMRVSQSISTKMPVFEKLNAVMKALSDAMKEMFD